VVVCLRAVRNCGSARYPRSRRRRGSSSSSAVANHRCFLVSVRPAIDFAHPLLDQGQDGFDRSMEAALADGGFAGRFLLMLSSGTVASPDVATIRPICWIAALSPSTAGRPTARAS